MKVLILYRDKSEQARPVETFIHDFKRRHGQIKVETAELDTRAGATLATTYDITAYPAILATKDDGSVLQIWQGAELPQIDDVASYSAG
jgi:hypothetical protein